MQLGLVLGLELEPARAFHWPLGELGDLGFAEHGRPIRRLARVLRGDEGIFRPICQDHEAMTAENISIGVRGHVRSNLQKAFLLDALCFRPRIFSGDSRLWGAFYSCSNCTPQIEIFS